MDGKKLYEYARESQPLPRPIPTRTCKVQIELIDFQPSSSHSYKWPTKRLSPEEKSVFRKLTQIVADSNPEASADMPDLDADVAEESANGQRPPTFSVRMTVSSGTYVRSIVHDIGLALGSAAHVVKLTRTRQGQFTLHPEIAKVEGSNGESLLGSEIAPSASSPDDASGEATTACIPWNVFERAIEQRKTAMQEDDEEKEQMSASGASASEVKVRMRQHAERRMKGDWKEWERLVMERFVHVPVPVSGSHTPAYPAYRK